MQNFMEIQQRDLKFLSSGKSTMSDRGIESPMLDMVKTKKLQIPNNDDQVLCLYRVSGQYQFCKYPRKTQVCSAVFYCSSTLLRMALITPAVFFT